MVKYGNFVDISVYSPKQNFRIVGSQKWKSGRIKIHHETWKYKGDDIKYQFRDLYSNEIKKFNL